MPVNRYKLLITILFVGFFANVNAQFTRSRLFNHYSDNFWIVQEKVINPLQLHTAPKYQYNGVDFSQLIVEPGGRVQDSLSTENILKWKKAFERTCTGENDAQLKLVMGKNLVRDSLGVESRKANNLNLSKRPRAILRFEDIQEIVKGYEIEGNFFPELSIIVELYDPELAGVLINFVFFDPATRDVLYYVKLQGKSSVAGQDISWEDAVYSAYFRFRKVFAGKKKKWKKELKNF